MVAKVSVRHALRPAEWLMLGLIGLIFVARLALVVGQQRQVTWQPFLVGIIATLGMVAIGSYARVAKGAPRLALCAIGIGVFMGSTACSAIFIFALFPLPNPLIDRELIQLDAMLGYDWVGFVAGLADYPSIAKVLRYVYGSSLPQIVLTIILLGVLGRETALHRFLLVGILTLIAAVGIWWLWPSIGPSAYGTIPPQVKDATGLLYDSQSGAKLRQLVEVGPPVISPNVIIGVVAFPSYHIIMACMVVWFTRGTYAFLPATFVNLPMVPATLSHGGHHLVDLVGGVFLFFITLWLVSRLIGEPAPAHP
jgi:hypothetical protein